MTTTQTPPADAGTPPAAATPPAATPSAEAGAPSLLAQQTANDWLPEKFRVLKDGTQDLDVDASARKLASSYSELEKARPSTGGTVPATADEYKIEGLADGINVDEVRADPVFKDVLDKAHKAGISNEAVNFFMQTYFNELAPNLFAANTQLDADAARTELAKVWNDPQAMSANLKAAMRAVSGFTDKGEAPGGFDRVMQKFGNDPDFLAFAAKIGSEMQEDQPVTGDAVAGQDWDAKIAEIRANPAYNDRTHPQHGGLVKQMEELYQRRYGTKTQKLGGAATR